MRPRLITLLAALAALLGLAVPAAPAAELGLNVNGGAAAATPENFAQLSDTGARWARHFVVFNGHDATDGGYDAIVEREQAMGIKTLFVVTGVGGRRVDDPEVYARFVGNLAARYRGRVDAYEIWNEEDEGHFWPGGPNAAEYVALLKASHRTIKAADPAATVVFGPTTGNNYAFLEQAYAAGAKGHFDAMAVHTDTACLVDSPMSYYREGGRVARFTFLGYREVRRTMLANGDDKPIWMTEFGWSATRNRCDRGRWGGQKDAGVSEAQQAQFLREAYHCLQEDPYVQVAMWFNSRDLTGDGSELDSYGLKRADGSERPATAAFRDVAAGRDTVTGPCGDFAAPRVQILSPSPGHQFGERDSLLVKAVSPDRDVLRMSFAVAGPAARKIRSFTNEGLPLDLARRPALINWFRARQLPVGRHTIVVTAVDKQGNEGTATVPVERVNPAALPAQPVTFRSLRLAGLGRRKVLTGALLSPLRFTIGGTVRVEWQAFRAGGWKKVHGGLKNAAKPFAFRQQLKYPGRWRVRVVYSGVRPHKRAASPWRTFTAR
jgi:hypothetical protein